MMLTRSKVVLVVVVSLQVCVMTVMLLSNIQVSSTGRLIEDGARHKHSTARDPFTVRITTDTIVAPEQGTEEMTEIMVRRLQQLRNGQMLSHVLHAESRYASPEEGSSNNSLDVQAATANLEQNSSHEGKEHQEAASSEKKRNRNLFFVKIISRDKPKTTMSESKNVRILGKVPHRISIHGSDKIFISVKYSDIHTERLLPMMLTWLQTVDGKQVHIVTDKGYDDGSKIAKQFGISVVPSGCPLGHGIKPLCCKSGWEFEEYYTAVERGEDFNWFCHFDDDIYVNIQNLVNLLKKHSYSSNVYLGHYSRGWKPIRIRKPFLEKYEASSKRVNATKLYYALGPAYCISKELMMKLPPFFRGAENFISTCETTGFPDDASVGAIIDFILGFEQFEVGAMKNELDHPERFKPIHFSAMVTYGYKGKHILHFPRGAAAFSEKEDPSRFLSLHCWLHPETRWCPPPSQQT